MAQALSLQKAAPRRASAALRRGQAAAGAVLPCIVLAMPFMDVPGIAGGAYVKPLALPLVLLAWVWILAQAGGGLSLPRDPASRRWLMLFAWAVVGAVCMPLLTNMPHEMKGQSLGARILRDLIAFSAGLMCWFYLRLAIRTDGQAVSALKWVLRSFALLLPFLFVQSLFVATEASWVSAIDTVLGLLRSSQTGPYKKIFGLAPEASMLADQLLSLYLPFTLASLLLGTSLFRRRWVGISAEAWITALAVLALLFSQSRIGLIALLFLALCGWVLSLRRHSQGAIGWQAVVLPALVVALAGGLTTLAGDRLTNFLGSFSSVDNSIDDGVWSNVTRLGSMSAGLDMAWHHPLGVGTGAFPFLFERHVPEWALISPEINALVGGDASYLQAATGSEGGDITTRLPDAKALPVRVLAEMGLPGFLLLAAIWSGLARGCWRTVRHPQTPGPVRTVAFGALLSLLTMLPLSFSINSYVWVHWILVAALAAAVGRAAPSKPRPKRIKPSPQRSPQ
jgi:hypothetical protein